MASRAIYRGSVQAHKSLGKKMSGHIAYALVVYTLMLIFMVAPVLEGQGTAIWPYLLLVVMVAAVILPCRNLERRWQSVVGDQGEGRFRLDVVGLWIAALGLPCLMMFGIRAIS